MEKITNSETVIATSDRILVKYSVAVWSFDKGFYSKINKEILQLEKRQEIMLKKGKCTNRNVWSFLDFLKIK